MELKNHNRREFIKLAVAGTAGIFSMKFLADKTFAADVSKQQIGAQLYTIRDGMQDDVKGSLKKIADIGYDTIELAGYNDGKFYGLSPIEFKKIANDLGLKIISSHSGVEVKGVGMENAKAVAEAHAKLGVKYCIQPWLVEERRVSADSYRKFVEELNMVGKVMKEYDIQFGYHNHNFEFNEVDGLVPYYDIYMKELDPELVTMEIDLYWTVRAGQDPVEIFKKYPGRFELYHVKDMENSDDKYFAPVGTGTIDFKRIFAYNDLAGLKYMFVEQDMTRDNKPFEALEISYTNLNNKIL